MKCQAVTTEDNVRAFIASDDQQPQGEKEQETESEKNTEAADEDTEMSEADKENQEPEPSRQEETTVETPEKQKTVVSAEKLQQLVLMHTYHGDAVQFIELLHKATPIITQLLSSKSKAEVLESMDFLVTGYNYKLQPATVSLMVISCRDD